MKAEHSMEEQTIEMELSDQAEWGKKDHPVQPDDMDLEPAPYAPEQAGNWREALVEAWPVIRAILIIFGFILLAINTLSWSIAQTPTRWPPLLFSIIFFLVASEKGSRSQHFQFLFFYLVGLITALWI